MIEFKSEEKALAYIVELGYYSIESNGDDGGQFFSNGTTIWRLAFTEGRWLLMANRQFCMECDNEIVWNSFGQPTGGCAECSQKVVI